MLPDVTMFPANRSLVSRSHGVLYVREGIGGGGGGVYFPPPPFYLFMHVVGRCLLYNRRPPVTVTAVDRSTCVRVNAFCPDANTHTDRRVWSAVLCAVTVLCPSLVRREQVLDAHHRCTYYGGWSTVQVGGTIELFALPPLKQL